MSKDDSAAIFVFTSETRQNILDQAGSADWVLNPKNAARFEYLVCCRKPDWRNRAEGIDYGTAFLVGRIAGLTKIEGSENGRKQPRYRIQISEYAEYDKASVWNKNLRNPVLYRTLKQMGVELRGLKFQPIPSPQLASGSSDSRMTIAEAKKALALTFGVKPEDVEIIIRG
jgi:hypothetical protein